VQYYVHLFNTIDQDELLQEARICLFRCMTTYQADLGSVFSTYFSNSLYYAFAKYARERHTGVPSLTDKIPSMVVSKRFYVLDFMNYILSIKRSNLRKFKVFYRNKILNQSGIQIMQIYKMSPATVCNYVRDIYDYVEAYNNGY